MIQKDFYVIAKLASGITSVVSVTYLLLTTFSLIFYFDCHAGTPGPNTEQFWATVYRVYLQDAECNKNTMNVSGITTSHTIFVLATISLSFSVVNIVTSSALFFMIDDASKDRNLKFYVYVYICSWFATFVVDLTLGTHFGIDVMNLGKQLDQSSHYDFVKETLRIGAFFLMSISLKGYVIHVISIIAIVLMLIFLHEHQKAIKRDVHSIHSQRALEAFESYGSSVADCEPPPLKPFPKFYRSRSSSFRKASGPSQHQQINPMQSVSANVSDRPFSYLEDRPMKPPVAPNVFKKPAPPPVPAPDYSPYSQRRLKSVLKPYEKY